MGHLKGASGADVRVAGKVASQKVATVVVADTLKN